MALLDRNVGPVDAQSRRVGAGLALLGGFMSLPSFIENLGFLAFVVYAIMGAFGLYYAIPGRRGGTAVFGWFLIGLAVFNTYAAWTGLGTTAFVVSLAVAAVGFVTARAGRCPVNGVLGVNSNR